MGLLIAGVLLWIGLHLIPVAATGPRQSLIDKLGENGYKGIFSLLMLSAMGLMVMGWRGATPSQLYIPGPELRWAALGLNAVAFILLAATRRPSRIGRVVRHPQLTGVLVWAIAHLLANGDSRSLVLFGGFAVWCIIMIVLINRRDGAWVKPEAPSLLADGIGVIAGLVVYAIVIVIHPWLSGMPLY